MTPQSFRSLPAREKRELWASTNLLKTVLPFQILAAPGMIKYIEELEGLSR